MEFVAALQQGHHVAYALVVLSLVAVVGLALGSVKVGGVRLGVGGALFSGIAFAHFGITLEPQLLDFVREFGLILFVYAIGLQVGPGFFNSLRKDGLALNGLAAMVVALGVVVTILVYELLDLPLAVALGLFSGATTNTPSLAAGQQILAEVGVAAGDRAAATLGYAVAYPFGIIGIIAAMILLRVALRIDVEREGRSFEAVRRAGAPALETMNIEVRNPGLDGIAVRDIPGIKELGVVLSRLLHDGSQQVVGPDQILTVGDVVLAVGPRDNLERLRAVLGGATAPVDLKAMASDIRWERMVVTRSKVLGRTIGELDLARSHGVVVSRVVRSGVELTPSASLPLHFGDILTVIGEPGNIDLVAGIVGNRPEKLQRAQIAPIFIGIALGVILGSVPIALPGLPVPIKLGLAGGPLVAAILLTRLGHIGPLVWFMPPSANHLLRDFGIVLFLGCAGLRSGGQFVDTLVDGQGLLWMAGGAAITVLPLVAAALVGRLLLKLNYLTLCGLLAGGMTDPPALAFANGLHRSEAQSLGYAAVYPLVMFLRVLAPQIMVLLLWP